MKKIPQKGEMVANKMAQHPPASTQARVLIRKYRHGDEKPIVDLVNSTTMITVNPFFFSAATKEMVAQAILIQAAVLFIIVGTSLEYSLVSLPATLGCLYFGIYMAHKIKADQTHGDLFNIQDRYLNRPKCGFWVAVLLEAGKKKKNGRSDSAEQVKGDASVLDRVGDLIGIGCRKTSGDYSIITEDQATAEEINSTLFPTGRTLIGTVAVDLKVDPDKKDPPYSVAIIRRMAVSGQHQRRGVGSSLLSKALFHCRDQRLLAAELITTEHHDAARNLYASKGFQLASTTRKDYLFGLVTLVVCRLRIPCSKIGTLHSQNLAGPEDDVDDVEDDVEDGDDDDDDDQVAAAGEDGAEDNDDEDFLNLA